MAIAVCDEFLFLKFKINILIKIHVRDYNEWCQQWTMFTGPNQVHYYLVWL